MYNIVFVAKGNSLYHLIYELSQPFGLVRFYEINYINAVPIVL